MRVSVLLAISLLALFALPAAADDGPISPIWKYKVTQVTATDLGVIGTYKSSAALDINNLGDVVGHLGFTILLDTQAGFYMRPGSVPMQAITEGISPHAQALSINDSRLVVGWMFRHTTESWEGFFWKPGLVPTPLNSEPMPIFGIKWRSEALAVNNIGTIVGWTRAEEYPPTPTCLNLAVSWSSTLATPAPLFCPPEAPAPDSFAVDVNDSGTIIGNDGGITFPTRMFIRKGGLLSAIPLPPATPRVTYSHGVAMGLNQRGDVVGLVTLSNNLTHAFHWNGTAAAATDIGVPAGYHFSAAGDVNAQQMLAGSMQRAFIGDSDAFIWHAHFGFRRLPALVETRPSLRCEATALNDRKESGLVQVVGWCERPSGGPHAVLWNVTVIRETVIMASSP
jgi:uncharacterized membrane protein